MNYANIINSISSKLFILFVLISILLSPVFAAISIESQSQNLSWVSNAPRHMQINITVNETDNNQNITNVSLNASGLCTEGNWIYFANTTELVNGSASDWTAQCTFNSTNASEGLNSMLVYAYNNNSENDTTTVNVSKDTIGPGWINYGLFNVFEADNFYSPYHANDTVYNDIITVYLNATDAGVNSIANVTADFRNLTNVSCNVKNMTYYNGYWNVTCNVSAYAQNLTIPVSHEIIVNATDSLGNVNTTAVSVLIHNLGSVQGPPPAFRNCSQESNDSTNMSHIIDFADVNYIVGMELNGTAGCNMGDMLPWNNSFLKVGLFNFTSVNMSTAEQAQAVMQAIGNTIRVDLYPPRSFMESRIYINSSAVSSLNTTANITLYNLPFSSAPNITYDGGGDNGASLYWSQGGYNATFRSVIGNLTIEVGNFSGYNITDNIAPIITINSPTNDTNVNENNTINITINGTGTEISRVILNITNATGGIIHTSQYYYNGSTNTTNCTQPAAGSELLNCQLNNVSMPAVIGNYTMTVTAYDYGGVAGNVVQQLSVFENNSAMTISSDISAANESNHRLILVATASDPNGVADMNHTTVTINDSTNIDCSYSDNSTNGTSLTVQYNCTNKTAFNSSIKFSANITFYDRANNSATTTTLHNLSLRNTAPNITAVALNSTQTTIYNFTNATCYATATDSENDTITYNYRWFVNGSNVYNTTAGTTNDTLDIANFSHGATIICEVIVNDSIYLSNAMNSSESVVPSSSNQNLSVNSTNSTNITETVTFNGGGASAMITLTVPNDTEVNLTDGYTDGFIYIANLTEPTGDLNTTNATGLSFRFGPPGTTFNQSINVTFNYSSLSSSDQASIETALAGGYMKAKHIYENGTTDTLSPVSYDTALNIIIFQISSFSDIGLYDATPAPTPAPSTQTYTSDGSGGGTLTIPRPLTTTEEKTEDEGSNDAVEPVPEPKTEVVQTPELEPTVDKSEQKQQQESDANNIEKTEVKQPVEPIVAQKSEEKKEDGLMQTIVGIVVILGFIAIVGTGAFVLVGGRKKGLK